MSIKNQISADLRAIGSKPIQGLGQNFLIDENIYRKIISTAEIKEGDYVFEIGPGLGTLTYLLAETGAHIIGVEKDHKLAEFLVNKFSDTEKVKIIRGDALETNPSDFGLENYKIVANIPYYITSHLLRTIFDPPISRGKWPTPTLIVLLVQLEVAQRIVAKPPHTNLLALSVQYFAKPKIVAKVNRRAFYPAPKVDSAIIRLEVIPTQESQEEIRKVFSVMKAGFSSKRKQLINNLSSAFKIPKEKLISTLSGIDINPKTRAENLSIKEWQKLTEIIFMP